MGMVDLTSSLREEASLSLLLNSAEFSFFGTRVMGGRR